MMSSSRRCALIVLCLLLGSCLDSDAPLSAPAESPPDARLYGAWRGATPGEETWLHIGAGSAGEAGAMRGLMIEHGADGTLKSWRYAGHPTRVGELELLSVRSFDEPSGDGWFLVRYRVDGRQLTLWALAREAAVGGIRAGEIAGRIGPGSFGDVRLTADTATLRRWIVGAPPTQRFAEPMKFVRATPP